MVTAGIFHGNFSYFTAIASALLAILGSFFYQHIISYDNLFAAVTSLFKTKIGIVGIYATTLIVAFLLTLILSRIILGRLSLVEVYVIHDNLLETCIELLMITAMFRSIASEKFFIPLIHMVVIKYFHWMLNERVGNMDRLPIISFTYSLRILFLGNILFINDVKLAQYFSNRSLDNTFVQFIFYEQYSILITYVIQNIAKYLLNFISNARREPLIFKSTIATFIDMIIFISRSIIYILFCMFFAMEQTLPLFIIIPLIKTLVHGAQHGYTLIKTYYIFSEINKRCPFMTDNEVEALNDKTCIVCREDMVHARRLPCMHAFHSNCLMLWVQNGSNCPTCRKDIVSSTSSPPQSANNDRNDGDITEPHPTTQSPHSNTSQNFPNNNNNTDSTTNSDQQSNFSNPSEATKIFLHNEITPIDDCEFPSNLGTELPIYQGIPTRLINFIKNTKKLSPFSAIKLIEIRYILKETDSLLLSYNLDQPNSTTITNVIDNATPNSVDSNTRKKEQLLKVKSNLLRAQQLIDQEISNIE